MSNYDKMHNHKYYCDDFYEKKYDSNNRFTGVSGPPIKVTGGHVHLVESSIDFIDHFHEFTTTSSLQIPVGDGRHVHFIQTTTSASDAHLHELIFVTLVDAPILEEGN